MNPKFDRLGILNLTLIPPAVRQLKWQLGNWHSLVTVHIFRSKEATGFDCLGSENEPKSGSAPRLLPTPGLVLLCDLVQHLVGVWVGFKLMRHRVWIQDEGGPTAGWLAYEALTQNIAWYGVMTWHETMS